MWVSSISRLTGAIHKFTSGSAFVCIVHILRCEVGSVARNPDFIPHIRDKRGFNYWSIEAENKWVLSIARSAFVRSGERCVDCGVGEAAEYALSGTVEIGGRSSGEVLIMGPHAKIDIISFTVIKIVFCVFIGVTSEQSELAQSRCDPASEHLSPGLP